ncbi:MAG: PD-(D/E)XK nuclease family protein [Cyanobacteria bacterium]|nr:PD-(D/E)XK nuclease family protein [Cyanobacteriota bacterium]
MAKRAATAGRTNGDLTGPLLPIAQGQLEAMERCGRLFQYRYLERWGQVVEGGQRDRMDWGNRFHLVAQQHLLGIDVGPVLATDPELDRCWRSLVAAAPELLGETATLTRSSEHRLTRVRGAYRLTVIYDLLALGGGRAAIVDWKTYPQPARSEHLARSWQTRLYRWMLAATGWPPEAIAMTYWFVRGAEQPTSVTLPYDGAAYDRDRADLDRLLGLIDQGRRAFLGGESLPQADRTAAGSPCDRCGFAGRCWGEAIATPLPDVSEISEVEI